jgi:hypothetical protein
LLELIHFPEKSFSANLLREAIRRQSWQEWRVAATGNDQYQMWSCGAQMRPLHKIKPHSIANTEIPRLKILRLNSFQKREFFFDFLSRT